MQITENLLSVYMNQQQILNMAISKEVIRI
jgi:hypothetical protein